jgi:hypothetical protein
MEKKTLLHTVRRLSDNSFRASPQTEKLLETIWACFISGFTPSVQEQVDALLGEEKKATLSLEIRRIGPRQLVTSLSLDGATNGVTEILQYATIASSK